MHAKTVEGGGVRMSSGEAYECFLNIMSLSIKENYRIKKENNYTDINYQNIKHSFGIVVCVHIY